MRAFFSVSRMLSREPREKEKKEDNRGTRKQNPHLVVRSLRGRLPDVEQHERGREDAAERGDVEEVALRESRTEIFNFFFSFCLFFLEIECENELKNFQNPSKEEVKKEEQLH